MPDVQLFFSTLRYFDLNSLQDLSTTSIFGPNIVGETESSKPLWLWTRGHSSQLQQLKAGRIRQAWLTSFAWVTPRTQVHICEWLKLSFACTCACWWTIVCECRSLWKRRSERSHGPLQLKAQSTPTDPFYTQSSSEVSCMTLTAHSSYSEKLLFRKRFK